MLLLHMQSMQQCGYLWYPLTCRDQGTFAEESVFVVTNTPPSLSPRQECKKLCYLTLQLLPKGSLVHLLEPFGSFSGAKGLFGAKGILCNDLFAYSGRPLFKGKLQRIVQFSSL